MKRRIESIQEELERREEEIQLKIESILEEKDEELREEMVLALDDEELEAFNEATAEMEDDMCEEKDECLNEDFGESDQTRLYEMAPLRKKKSNLPVNLSLDDSGSYLTGGHSPRIKFQGDKQDSPNTRIMIPMTIADAPPRIPLKGYRRQLEGINENDIQAVRRFVEDNRHILLRLCNPEDEYDIQNFLNDMMVR